MSHQMKPSISDFSLIRSIASGNNFATLHDQKKRSQKRHMIAWEDNSDGVRSIISGDGASDEKFNFIFPTHPNDCIENFVATKHDKKHRCQKGM